MQKERKYEFSSKWRCAASRFNMSAILALNVYDVHIVLQTLEIYFF